VNSKTFHVSILTPEKAIYEGEVSSLVAPSELGYMGVLVDHAPLIANLKAGKIVLKTAANDTKTFYLNGKGFLEILKNNATLLLDSVEPAVS